MTTKLLTTKYILSNQYANTNMNYTIQLRIPEYKNEHTNKMLT